MSSCGAKQNSNLAYHRVCAERLFQYVFLLFINIPNISQQAKRFQGWGFPCRLKESPGVSCFDENEFRQAVTTAGMYLTFRIFDA